MRTQNSPVPADHRADQPSRVASSGDTGANGSESPACRAYVRELLALYVQIPGVLGRVRQADRHLARQLYHQRIPFYAVERAFIVGAARRIRHNAFSTPLPQIRSLHYFKGLITEMLDRPPGLREIDHLRRSLGLGDPPR